MNLSTWAANRASCMPRSSPFFTFGGLQVTKQDLCRPRYSASSNQTLCIRFGITLFRVMSSVTCLDEAGQVMPVHEVPYHHVPDCSRTSDGMGCIERHVLGDVFPTKTLGVATRAFECSVSLQPSHPFSTSWSFGVPLPPRCWRLL